MEECGLKHKDVRPALENKGPASEILKGRRSIGKTLAERLPRFFYVPLDLFI